MNTLYEDDAPIHNESMSGLLSVIQYLIEKQSIVKGIKTHNEMISHHCSCKERYLLIAKLVLTQFNSLYFAYKPTKFSNSAFKINVDILNSQLGN